MLKRSVTILVGCAVSLLVFFGYSKDAGATAIIDLSPITTGGTLIDFEGFSNFANADNLFLTEGVRFEAGNPPGNTVIRHDPNPDYTSLSGIASLRNPYTVPTDMNMIFSSPLGAVEFYFADGSPLANYVFTAFGNGGTVLDSVTLTPTYLRNNESFAFITFMRPTADIWEITVDSLTTTSYSTDFYGIDDLRLGGSLTAVPEPSTFLLLGGGLAGLAFVARRRRKE